MVQEKPYRDILCNWENRLSMMTVLSANRDNSAPQGSKVELTRKRILVLNYLGGGEIWAQPATSTRASYAFMLDTGNFVLANEAGSNLWESFGEPTDTIVPSQVLNQGTEVISRYSAMNYSRGRFRLLLQLDGNLSRNGSLAYNITSGTFSSMDLYQRAVLEYDGVFRYSGNRFVHIAGHAKRQLGLSNYKRYEKQDENFCRQVCLSDCLCNVAIFKEGNCWKKRMPFSNGVVDPTVRGKALIKVKINNSTPKIGCPKKKGNGPLVIIGSAILSSSAVFNLILLLLTSLIWFRYFHGKNARTFQLYPVKRFSRMQSFTHKDLTEATGGFNEEMGWGAYGSVYKGVLASNDRRVITVKVLEKITPNGDREFKTEVDTIGWTNQRNLVELIGFCNDGKNHLLVYEFMPNGSLADFRFGGSRLSWFKRIEIACGVARGLFYLHGECSKQIIHCDIKPQNILLDESLTAKISDFGLAKLFKNDQTQTVTAVRGTKGYLAPEWFRNMPISVKVDVYSFGIVLLELICCRKNCEFELNDEAQMILSDWVYNCYHEDKLDLIVEGDEETLGDMSRVRRFVMIAMWCIQEEPSMRPSMKKVTQMLEGVVEVSIPPGPFSFISSILTSYLDICNMMHAIEVKAVSWRMSCLFSCHSNGE
ncbi:G-type lectin S-receptor-like serine/threonine-protein kinase LECRK2 [Punica granatum]|uniref:non-specific serine/threonine protein kinase n=1 Tax=Punica granatum TaxID=22663 RepID=A0A6P8CTU1_PUNGR|nr:G-type lectin S-receptor-like serine/threonine-protein kinase LECRK2 [Punica granatum]